MTVTVSATVAAVVSPVIATIVASADAVGDHGSGADDRSGPGDRSADDTAARCSSWTKWHVNLLR